jgi:hypothetical protein
MADNLRYTMTTDTKTYAADVQAVLDGLRSKGYDVPEHLVENSWDRLDYKGINVNVKSPSGYTFELQFHTKESLAAKRDAHVFYEKARLKTTPEHEQRVLYGKMEAVWRGVPEPPGILKLGDLQGAKGEGVPDTRSPEQKKADEQLARSGPPAPPALPNAPPGAAAAAPDARSATQKVADKQLKDAGGGAGPPASGGTAPAAAATANADAVLAKAGAPVKLTPGPSTERLRGVLERPNQKVEATKNSDNYGDTYDLVITPDTPGWKTYDRKIGDLVLGQDTYDPKLASLQEGKTGAMVALLSPEARAQGWSDNPGDVMDKRDGMLYRGVSAADYEQIQKTGQIQSNGQYNLGTAQEGLTSYGADPLTAASYAGGFAPAQFQPTPGRPNYVIEVKRPDNAIDGNVTPESGLRGVEGEVGVPGAVPASEIQRVWEVRSYTARPTKVTIRPDSSAPDSTYGEGSASYQGGSLAYREVKQPDQRSATQKKADKQLQQDTTSKPKDSQQP